MNYEQYQKLKKGNMKVYRALSDTELPKLWYMVCAAVPETDKAAVLLLSGWKSALSGILHGENPPREEIRALVSAQILKDVQNLPEGDSDFAGLELPAVKEAYRPFAEAIAQLPPRERYLYLLSQLGGLDTKTVAVLTNTDFYEVKKQLSDISLRVTDSDRVRRLNIAEKARLTMEFQSTEGIPFQDIRVPDALMTNLEHEYLTVLKELTADTGKSGGKKAKTPVKTEKSSGKTAKRSAVSFTKPLITAAVIIALGIVAAVVLSKVIGSGNSSTRITTYNVDEVTYGNVTETISGSGTLTPITRETLVSLRGGAVEEVNYTVGDTVEADAVIAVIGGEELTAPYDGVLIELPIRAGDEIAAGGEAAMIMGLDGFTMGIAVDETEISLISLDQNVKFTLDAVEGSYSGWVSAISYNGSSNGGTTAFQITAAVDYIEGVYPGMSATAKIVIEDSGEGLLVPVDAVRTSGDDSYVLLAPDDAENGDTYDEDELDESDLVKVTVETGMSDGSYMIVKSSRLSEGDLIVITEITSTQTGSDYESDRSSFGGSGFPGGGMDFSDFDFSNFDPSSMPSGGFPGGY